jgi:acid phosphatase type 7
MICNWVRPIAAGLLLAALPFNAHAADGPFVVKPYVQLGDRPTPATAEGMSILWHAADEDADWTVEVKGISGDWAKVVEVGMKRVAVEGLPPHRVYRADANGLAPGETFEYRVKRVGKEVFSASARARRPAGQPQRFVVFGDCAQGTPEQKLIANRTYLAKPDYVMITGDIVYSRGQASEWREKFFPVYNADDPSPAVGVPLIRSTPIIAAPGNHDTMTRDLAKYPDALAYFYYMAQPLNGPAAAEGGKNTPTLSGPEPRQAAFRDLAGPSYPRMANFSFDYGDAHWTVLDANPYVDPTDPALRDWIARDLAAARGKTWRFVSFHQPGFNSSRAHFEQQYMRLLSEVFEAGAVDIVFNGHVHNYQRSYPLRFVPRAGTDGKLVSPKGEVAGTWTLDRSFDGATQTVPNGVIYIVTGAGGAGLYNREQQDNPASWQGFTHKFISRTHSITVADLDGPRLTITQVTPDGNEVDRFVVTKPSSPSRAATATVGGR